MASRTRWSREPFLRAACRRMADHLDWDSLDSGRLHEFTGPARTAGGDPVVVGVLDRPDVLPDVLADAAEARAERAGWERAPLWLYVPPALDVGDVEAVVHRVA